LKNENIAIYKKGKLLYKNKNHISINKRQIKIKSVVYKTILKSVMLIKNYLKQVFQQAK